MVAGAVKRMPETGLWITTKAPSVWRGMGGNPLSTRTAAVASLEGSATGLAVTTKLPAACPAVKRPVDVIAPPVAVQVTAVGPAVKRAVDVAVPLVAV